MLKVKLVVFDVDGVLVPIKSSWHFLHSYFDVLEKAENIKRMFDEGLIDYTKWLELDVKLWIEARNGLVTRDEIMRVLSQIKVDDEAHHVVRWLKRRGVKIALISGGIDLLVSRIAEEIGADIWMANKLSFDKRGYLIAGGIPIVGVWKDKAVRILAGSLGINLDNIMFIGDSKWDIPALKIVGYPVAYRDDGVLSSIAKYRVNKLLELIDLIKCIEDHIASHQCANIFKP
ncbi:MAG: HAD-IB family phosphatase [Acidilobaceae archaeon]